MDNISESLHPYLESMLRVPEYTYIKEHRLLKVIDERYTTKLCNFELQAVYADVHQAIVLLVIGLAVYDRFTIEGIIYDSRGKAYTSKRSHQHGFVGDRSSGVTLSFNMDEYALAPGPAVLHLELNLYIRDDDYRIKIEDHAFFNLTVLVRGKREAMLQQTRMKDGVAMTLERIAITPSETRIWLRLGPIASSAKRWLVSRDGVSIVGHDWLQDTIRRIYVKDKVIVLSYLGSLYEVDDFTLKVNELVSQNETERIDGPWIFHFTVPPATTQP